MSVMLTAAQLRKMCVGAPNAANLNSVLMALNDYGQLAGLDDPVNLSHYLPQLLHESGSFRFDREIWGPTKAQKGYEGRKDLGNIEKGDGSKFRGFGPIQLTGRRNVTRFYNWCKKKGLNPPNFIKQPSLIATDPWEGLSAIWYWDEGNPEGKSLNKYAQDNNITMVTKRINGGLNGFEDRLMYYGRVALVLLGYGVSENEIKRFQKEHKLTVDGEIGDQTRMAMHKALNGDIPYAKIVEVPVTVHVEVPGEQVPVPVKVASLDKPWYTTLDGAKEMFTTVGGTAVVGFITDMPWEKLALIFAVLLVASLGWYIIRRRQAAQQNAAVAQINAANAAPAIAPTPQVT